MHDYGGCNTAGLPCHVSRIHSFLECHLLLAAFIQGTSVSGKMASKVAWTVSKPIVDGGHIDNAELKLALFMFG